MNLQKDHNEHAAHFVYPNKSTYHDATFKGLITNGSNKKMVIDRVKQNRVSDGVEMIGLVVSVAHDAYEIYVKSSQTNDYEGPLVLFCDRVAKSLERDPEKGMRLASAQQLSREKKEWL